MHHNDLKCGEIVDNLCYILKLNIKVKVNIKNRIGGGGGNVG